MDPLRWPKFFATIKHGDQLYAGTLPYTHHLAAVEAVLRRFGCGAMTALTDHETDEALLTAAWLHDVVEDTRKKPEPVKRKHISEMFGERVADLVEAVTDELGENRKARKAATYPKTRACPGAVALKLADRIANLEHGGDLVKMYRKEQEDFKRNLYTPGAYEEMWARIEELLEVQ